MQADGHRLLGSLTDSGVLRTQAVRRALERIDRKDFVPDRLREQAYADRPLPIGYGQTISQPFTVVFMLELLGAQAGDKILDVGSGSGWTTALLAEMVGRKGKVFGVERIPELVEFGQQNLEKYDFSQASIQQAGAEIGLPSEAPFDRILVSAAATSLPRPLVTQLRPGGVMVIPVLDTIYRVRKINNEQTEMEQYPGFEFVPLL